MAKRQHLLQAGGRGFLRGEGKVGSRAVWRAGRSSRKPELPVQFILVSAAGKATLHQRGQGAGRKRVVPYRHPTRV